MATSHHAQSHISATPEKTSIGESALSPACNSDPIVCHVRVDVVAPPLNRVLVVTEFVPAGDPVVSEASVYMQLSPSAGPRIDYATLYAQLTDAQRKFIESLEPIDDDLALGLSPEVDFFRRAFKNNSHSLGGSQNAAVFKHISFAEHSCCPNAFFISSFPANRGSLIAMKDLSPGDRVTISYIRPPHGYNLQVWPRWMRREHLFRHRGFTCACDICRRSSDGSQSGSAMSSFFKHLCEELRLFFESSELYSGVGFDTAPAKSMRARFLDIAGTLENSLNCLSKQLQVDAESAGITMTELVFYHMHLRKTLFEFHVSCFSYGLDDADHFSLALQYLEQWCSSFPAENPESAFAAHECLALLFDAAWDLRSACPQQRALGVEKALEEVRILWRSFGKIKCYWMPHLGIKMKDKCVYTDYLEAFGRHGDDLPTMETLLRDLRAARSRLSSEAEEVEDQAPEAKRLKPASS